MGGCGLFAVPLGFALEDHGVEAVADVEAGVLVERHGGAIGFGDGESDGSCTGAGEALPSRGTGEPVRGVGRGGRVRRRAG